MATLSVNQTTTFRWSLQEDVIRYANASIPAIGVWRQKLWDCGQDKAVELLKRSGLKVSHLFWAGGFTGSDGRSYRESVEDAREAILSAAALGTQILTVCSGARGGHTYNHARRLIQSALKELLPLAEEMSLTLAVEPMHPGCAWEFTFLNSLEETLMVLDAVAHPLAKLVFDTYHLGHTPGIVEQIPKIASKIALVQLGDARAQPEGEQNRCRLGEGILPLKEIVAALKSAGYDGYYDVELIGEEFEPAHYESLLEHAKEAFATLMAG
jgi:sugar phosphate isomerase/epimerase